MKNKLFPSLAIFIISILIIPRVTLAAWWNPISWFEREKGVQLNAKPTKGGDLESAAVIKSNNVSSITVNSFDESRINESSVSSIVLGQPDAEGVAQLKATIVQLQKEIDVLRSKGEQVKNAVREIPVEKIIYRDRVIEKPTEKIVYRDNMIEKPVEKIVEKPIEKIVYRDRVIERPVEKIVYQDRIVQTSCSAASNPSSSAVSQSSSSASSPYSDYNFDYKWDGYVLSCPMTPRNIGIKKAVFQIPDSELQKINNWKSLEVDGFKVTIPILHPELYGQGKKDPYSLEERSANTFVYFGGPIPICGDGAVVSVGSMRGTLSDISGSGRNIKAYLEQKGITIDGQETVILSNGDLRFEIHASPIMSEWDVWDYTNNKPVKIK